MTETEVTTQRARPGGRRHRPEWPAEFLDAYARLGSVTDAARAAGVSRTTVYRRIEKVQEFADAVADADKILRERAEREVVTRGIHGYDETTTEVEYDANGAVVGRKERTVRRASDRLLLAFLAAKDPERWSVRWRGELSGPGGAPMSWTNDDAITAEIERLLAEIAAKGGSEPVPQTVTPSAEGS